MDEREPANDSPDIEPGPLQSRGKLIALAIAALLIGLGWLVVDKLGDLSRTQDCLLSGRTNCAPIRTD